MTTITAKYTLANHAGYHFDITKIGEYQYDDLAYFHKKNFPDVKVTRPNSRTDLSLLHSKALMTVNGFIHNTVWLNDELYIPSASSSMLKHKLNHVGVLSFNDLPNPLSKIKIHPSMVTGESGVPLYNKAIITFDREIKNAFIVIAGYMVFEQPEFFYRVSANSFALRLDRLMYMEKIYELTRHRNILEELGVPVSPNNDSMVDVSVIRSDEVITKFLSTYNSFLVEVPCKQLSSKGIYLEHSTVPGNFRCEVEPTNPIITDRGKFAEYMKRQNNDRKYTVYINDSFYSNYLFSTLPDKEIDVYNNHRVPNKTYRLVSAKFLEISMTT